MAEQRRLTKFVEVDGTWYGPDDDVPADVAEKIQNPRLWAGEPDQAEGDGDEQESRAKAGTPSGHRLARHVEVDGTWYGPDSYVPDKVAAKVTNAKAWEGGKLPASAQATAQEQAAQRRAPALALLPGSGTPAVRAGAGGAGGADGDGGDDSNGSGEDGSGEATAGPASSAEGGGSVAAAPAKKSARKATGA